MTSNSELPTPTSLPALASGIWYHGTFSDIDQFWPFTHLGSREAAITALALHYFADGWRGGTPQLIRLSLTFDDAQALREFPDWNMPNVIGVAYAFELFGVEDNALCCDMRKELVRIRDALVAESNQAGRMDNLQLKARIRTALITHAQHRLIPWLSAKGIRALLYRNVVEEEAHDHSLCIMDAAVLNTAKREVIPVSMLELADAQEALPRDKVRVSQDQFDAIAKEIAAIRAKANP